MKKIKFKIFDDISKVAGWIINICIAFIITDFLYIHYFGPYFGPYSEIVHLIILLIIYLGSIKIIEYLGRIAFNCSIDGKYKTAIIMEILTCWLDIVYSVKFIEINILALNGQFNNLKKYFDCSNFTISFLSLAICAQFGDKELVVKWFENKYIAKNLQIESNYYEIYEYISKIQ